MLSELSSESETFWFSETASSRKLSPSSSSCSFSSVCSFDSSLSIDIMQPVNYGSGQTPPRFATQEQFAQWQAIASQQPQYVNPGYSQYLPQQNINANPSMPQPGNQQLGNRPNPHSPQSFQSGFTPTQNQHYQQPLQHQQPQTTKQSFSDAPPSYEEAITLPVPAYMQFQQQPQQPQYYQPSYLQNVPPHQFVQYPSQVHQQPQAQQTAQPQQSYYQQTPPIPSRANRAEFPEKVLPGLPSLSSLPSVPQNSKHNNLPSAYANNVIQEMPDTRTNEQEVKLPQGRQRRPTELHRQDAESNLGQNKNPVFDSNGNPVVFFNIPQKIASPSPAEKPKRVRPSGLVETIRRVNPELQSDIHHFQMENYAKEFFQQKRRGLFRRAIKVESLLEWGKELHGSLLNTLSDKHEKEALEIFKSIQMYMGDRPMPKKGSIDLAQAIATPGVTIPELRDEIYCQLIKQVTLNPSIPSTIKGWELLAIAIESFPCTMNLEPYVRSYLHESAMHVDTSRVSVYAAYCLRRYDARWKHSTVVRIPTKEEIKHIQQDPFSGAMFGGSLEEIMSQQKEDFPNVHIPRVMAVICDCILESGGESAQGIFRISANLDKVYQSKVILEKGASTLDKNDNAHIPACLLKTWLYELKNPIIPAQFYSDFIENETDIQKLSDTVYNELPDVNRNTLLFLIRFLRIIGKPENQVYTLMNLHNLALIFSPNVFRCPIADPMTQLQNTKIETNVLELLLKELALPDSIPGVYGVRGSA